MEKDLRARIAAIDHLLAEMDKTNTMDHLRKSQQERKAELEERLRQITTCSCGKGKPVPSYPRLEQADVSKQAIQCYCNGKIIWQ